MKRALITFIGLVAFELATCWERAFDVTIDLPIGFFKYLLLVWFLISRKKISSKEAVIMLPSFLIEFCLLGVIIDQKLPSLGYLNIFFEILGIWAGRIISSKQIGRATKLLIPVPVLLFSIWYIEFNGYYHYLSIINGQGFSGRMQATKVNYNWSVYDKNNLTFTKDNWEGKIVYVDFWTTSCGVCFIKFPELEKLYQQFKNNPNVIIQAVNIPIERDTLGMAFRMVDQYGKYSFPVVIGTDAMREAFKVTEYPTVVVLKNNEILFRGRTELANSVFEDLVND